jgi:hypothetical protein
MGFFCPQNSISEEILCKSVGPVAEELKFHGVFGYITVDFVLLAPVSGPGHGSSIVRYFFFGLGFCRFFRIEFLLRICRPSREFEKLGKLPLKFFGIWQIRGATVKMNLKSNFWKYANEAFLKNDIRYRGPGKALFVRGIGENYFFQG